MALNVGFTQYPGTGNVNLIEAFTATSGSDIGSMTESIGSNFTYDSDGVLIGSASELSWPSAFLISNTFSNGFTVQFEMEGGMFASTTPGSTDETLIRIAGTDNVFLRRRDTQNAFAMSNGGTLATELKTANNSARSHTIVTISFDPAIGAEGTIDLYIDFMHLGAFTLNAAPDFDDVFSLNGNGGSAPNSPFSIRNVVIFKEATTLTGVNEKEIAVVGDSFLRYGQYQFGAGSNNDPSLFYDATDWYGDGSTDGFTTYRNSAFFPELHYQLALQNIYPKGGRLKFYGRGGTEGLSSAPMPLSDRISAALQSTGATFPPSTFAPVPGLGAGAIDIAIVHVGTNDVRDGNDPATVLADIKTELDILVSDGAERIVVDLVARRYDNGATPTTQIDVAETEAMNAQLSTLSGYQNITTVADVYTDWPASYVEGSDGIHPNGIGQVQGWAPLVAAAIAAPVTPTLTTPFSIGTNNGPLFSVTTSNTLAVIESAGFFNDNAGYASLLKTDDVLIIQASNGTKMYTVTVDKELRIISLSTGLVIA